MFHMRKLSNTCSTPAVFSSKSTKSSETAPPNHTSSTSMVKSFISSTKSSHRRGRPSIDKSQVSKPLPIPAYDERRLFDAMASGSVRSKERRTPKAAEKKVTIDVPKLTESSPQHKPEVSANKDSRSWYTPATVQTPHKASLQRSISSATPRTTPSKFDPWKNKEYKSHGRAKSETLRDGTEPTKRRVDKQLITHPDCPWITCAPNADRGHWDQHRPVRSATGASYESDETAVEDGTPTVANVNKELPILLAKPAQDTLNPTIRLLSKPLPNLPVSDSVASRWSLSTGSVYSTSDGDPFSYDQILSDFPRPPQDGAGAVRFHDWEASALSAPSVYMSSPNTSSSSVETVVPMATADPPIVKPLMLRAVPEPKVATVVYQDPRASCSFDRIQDSIAIHRARACPKKSVKGRIHPLVLTPGSAPTLRRRSSSFSSSDLPNPHKRLATLEAILFPHLRNNPEELKKMETERLAREKKYDSEREVEQELEDFKNDFGLNPWYKGRKFYEREVDPNANEFELIKPEKTKRRWR